MVMDKITEAIAHFIGLFEIAVEEGRLRKDYTEFVAVKAGAGEHPELPDLDAQTKAPFEFVEMDPGLRYQPADPHLVEIAARWQGVYPAPQVPAGPVRFLSPEGRLPEMDLPSLASTRFSVELDPPHSVVARMNQKIALHDNDYVSVGDHGLIFTPVTDHAPQIAALVADSAELSPFGVMQQPGSADSIDDFVTQAASDLKTFAQQHAEDDGMFIVDQDVITGIYVNGKMVDERPDLNDHLPRQSEDETAGEPDPAKQQISGSGELRIDASVDLEAGGNTMVNTVTSSSNWLAGTVTAIVGDHIELNAIIQINAWSDNDLVGSSLNGWSFDPESLTESFNIAMFQRIDPTESDGKDAQPIGGFPENWAVTQIDGDMIFMNWIEQFSFVMDNDIHVLSSSGVMTTVTTGGNTALNSVSFQELGYYYDLIIVGGSVYDVNIIQQMNVLFDDDIVGAVSGFQTTGEANFSTSGNLLWNSASITNVGGADRFDTLPEHYRQAAENLAAGNQDLPGQVLQDDAFANLGGLRVLYVTGDVIDVQYVKQTNVLGDADQVALAMERVGEGHPEADWTIATGSNALVNMASIIDVDSGGKTYVGGDKYSDEMLIQAELVSSDPDLGGRDPDVLISEAVAFLDDDAPDAIGADAPSAPSPAIDAGHIDGMQSILA